MSTRYVVKQGDYLAKIAREHGYTDFMAVWNAGENAALRQERESPNVLFPGDVVLLPDLGARHEDGQTEQRHHFVLKGNVLKLRLVVEDAFRTLVRDTNCDLDVGGRTNELRTDGDGRVELEIAKDTEQARFVLREADSVFNDTVLDIRVGELDPVSKLDGQVKRLINLGYLRKPVADRNAAEFLSAMQEFQCDHDLLVDGRCGPVTQAQLEKVHGS